MGVVRRLALAVMAALVALTLAFLFGMPTMLPTMVMAFVNDPGPPGGQPVILCLMGQERSTCNLERFYADKDLERPSLAPVGIPLLI